MIFGEGEVFVIYVFYVEYYNFFVKVVGIVMKVDSIFFYLVIIVREFGIFCVVGVDVEVIRDGDEVIVDGNKGVVYVRNLKRVLKGVEFWKLSYCEDEIVRELKEEYLKVLEKFLLEELENVIVGVFLFVREYYLMDREKVFNVYYFINWFMEEEMLRFLVKCFDVIDIFLCVDRGEKLRINEEERFFEIYWFFKVFINYMDERVRDILRLLFGV